MELTPGELDHATLLRALEWGYMPLFATQVLAPASFLFVPWWYVPVNLVLVTWAWHPLKYALASYRVATIFCLVNAPPLRWLMGLGFGVFYVARGQYLLAGMAVLWPLVVLILMWFCPPTKNGELQRLFVSQIRGEET